MKTIQYIYMLIFLLVTASCQKKEVPYETLSDSKEGVFISIPKAHNGINQLQVFPADVDERFFTFSASYGGLGLPLHEINVVVEEDLYALDSVNRIRELSGLEPYARFPRESYVLDKMDMVIPAGKTQSSPITLTYYPGQFDPDKEYLLALSIVKSSSYAVDPVVQTILIATAKKQEHSISVDKSSEFLDFSGGGDRSVLFDAKLAAEYEFSSDFDVTFSPDLGLLEDVNNERIALGLLPFEAFPVDAYTLTRATVTIAGGSLNSDQGELIYKPDLFDQTKNYLLPLTITDASGYDVDPEKSTLYLFGSGQGGTLITATEMSDQGWTVTSSPYHDTPTNPREPKFIIDGAINTWWEARYGTIPNSQFQPNPFNATYPHWLRIDMKEAKFIDKVELHRRYIFADHAGSSFRTFDLRGSLDGVIWFDLNLNQTFPFHDFNTWPSYSTKRYFRYLEIKMTAPNTANEIYAHLGEVRLYEY